MPSSSPADSKPLAESVPCDRLELGITAIEQCDRDSKVNLNASLLKNGKDDTGDNLCESVMVYS